MLDTIRKLLAAEELSGWIIRENMKESVECFFVREKLDMNRRTRTHEFTVKVFLDFEEEGQAYTGDATAVIGICDSREEAERKIKAAAFAAALTKNKAYPLPQKSERLPIEKKGYANIKLLSERYDELMDIFFGRHEFDAHVNSVEIFANEETWRVVTSGGVDITYPHSEFMFELVTDNNSGREAVEIFNDYTLSSPDLERIREITRKQLMETEGRSRAVEAKQMEHCRLVLSGDAVEQFLAFYVQQASDERIYQKVSRAKKGQRFVPENARQPLTIRMNPGLDSSPYARPVDGEGTILEPYTLYENGVVQNIRTTAQYSHYLGIPHLGHVQTFEVEGGKNTLEEILDGDYVEIIAFSAFLTDPVTGDFGGEFRLAKMMRSGELSYITGGAISENIFRAQATMLFTKEMENRTYSRAPKAIIFENVTITGK